MRSTLLVCQSSSNNQTQQEESTHNHTPAYGRHGQPFKYCWTTDPSQSFGRQQTHFLFLWLNQQVHYHSITSIVVAAAAAAISVAPEKAVQHNGQTTNPCTSGSDGLHFDGPNAFVFLLDDHHHRRRLTVCPQNPMTTRERTVAPAEGSLGCPRRRRSTMVLWRIPSYRSRHVTAVSYVRHVMKYIRFGKEQFQRTNDPLGHVKRPAGWNCG